MNRLNALDAFRRFWWVAASFTVIGAVLGALPEPARSVDSSTTFTATYTLLIGSDDPTGLSSANTLVNQIETFARRGEVPKRVAESLDLDETAGPGLAAQITVGVNPLAFEVAISTVQADPLFAVDLVNAFGEELAVFIAERQDEVTEARLARLLERLDALEDEIESLQTDLRREPDDAVAAAKLDAASRQYSAVTEQYGSLVADNSRLSLTPLETGTALANPADRGLGAPATRSSRALALGLIGFAVGAAVVVALGRLDRRIRTRAHAEAVFEGPTAVGIPVAPGTVPGLVVLPERHDRLSDAYRTLRSVVVFTQASRPLPDSASPRARITLVVSACAGDGKTAVAANLAAAMGENGRRVVAVNADFRRPTLRARLTGQPIMPPSYLLSDVPALPMRTLLTPTLQPNVMLLDLTPVQAPPGAVARATLGALPKAAAISECMVIDTSPAGLTAEVLDFVPLADSIVVVIRLNHTLVRAARRTLDLLHSLSSAQFHLVVVGDSLDHQPYDEYGDTRPRRRGRPGRSALIEESVALTD